MGLSKMMIITLKDAQHVEEKPSKGNKMKIDLAVRTKILIIDMELATRNNI